MKDLRQILKENGQNQNQANTPGKLEFNKKAGCLVYSPPKTKIPKNKAA